MSNVEIDEKNENELTNRKEKDPNESIQNETNEKIEEKTVDSPIGKEVKEEEEKSQGFIIM